MSLLVFFLEILSFICQKPRSQVTTIILIKGLIYHAYINTQQNQSEYQIQNA